MSLLALDIGGANLKAADGLGFARSHRFPLWKRPESIADGIRDLMRESPEADCLAVTITGELADCFQTKAEGIDRILSAVDVVAAGREIHVYLCNGDFCSPKQARENYLLASASNWHVLGSFVARYSNTMPAMLIDIGSTTADFIPFGTNGATAVGITDPERLATGELVYTGIERSPVCALVKSLPWRGERCGVAQELFATAADAYVVLGKLAEDSNSTDTADGRPLTQANSHARLARMVCADTTIFDSEDANRVAEEIQDAQLSLLESGFRKVVERMDRQPQTIVLSGHGEFLSRCLLNRLGFDAKLVSLDQELGPALSRCGPAHALAVLARERITDHG